MVAARYRLPPSSGNAYMRDLLTTSALAAIVGALTGLVAVGVRSAISLVTGLLFRSNIELSYLTFTSPAENTLGIWVIAVPALGAAIAYLIVRLTAGDRRIRGASEIVRSVAHRGGKISRRKLGGHATANVVSVGSGGSAGREGIMVQLGAMLGMFASLVFGTSVRHRKILLGAGGAAAIGATFNTPIAGVIFAAEVILIEWSTRSFIPLTVSSAMGVLVASNFLGDEPTFPIPGYELVTARELLLYIVLGILCGLLAIATLRLLALFDKGFAAMPVPDWVPPVIGGLLVGVLGFLVPEVLGVGYETVTTILSGEFVAVSGGLFLVVLLLTKLVAFAITRGSGGASGAFSPSLFLGASLGAAFGVAVNLLFPGSTGPAAAYALVGMAAVFAAVTRASLTAVVMLYEMTHTFSIVLPVMLAVVVADALAKAYGVGSYYASGAKAPLETDAMVNVLDIVTVGEIMSKPAETVPADAPVRSVVEKRFTTGHQGYPVVDASGALVGIVTATDMRSKVREGELDRPIRDFMTREPATITPEATAHAALNTMVALDIGHLPVVDERDRSKLVGFLTRTDLFRVERRTLEEESPGEATLFSREGFSRKDR